MRRISMKKSIYTPLRYAQLMDASTLPDIGFTGIIRRLISESDDVMKFLWYDTNFMNPDYTGPYRYINEYLFKYRSELYKILTGNATIPKSKDRDRNLAADIFSTHYIVTAWARSKQVYKFDAELELSLTSTEEVELPVRILDRLPYHTFYVDFADEGIFKSNYHGAFLHIVPEQAGYLVFVMIVKDDGHSRSSKMALVPGDDPDGTFFFSKENFADTDCINCDLDWTTFVLFIVNALLYLCANNSEVEESILTKQTYRPSKTIKNRFSEVRQWECGYRYGAAVRKSKANGKGSLQNNNETVPQDARKIHSRRTVIEHVRRAHWHHYWTGKRDEERKLILHWIPPTIVRGQKCDAAVIHKVESGQN